MLVSDQILTFFAGLRLRGLPREVGVLNPYGDPAVFELCKRFYGSYYADNAPRTFIIGINPGRFGGGVTGIPFTDPIRLEAECGLANDLQKKPEMSSEFIYRMIRAFGGPEKFYRHFYIGSVSPLGFTQDGKNLNYYDHPVLEKKLTPFIVASLKAQLGFKLRRDICFCLGEGKNSTFLTRLNSQYKFFDRIVPLAHPRFIMQYRRKKLQDYITDYCSKFQSALSS